VSTKSKKSNPPVHLDDLTAIKGIKQARQQWFRDTFNAHTYADMAALSANEVEARLKAEKQIPSRSMIEAWLEQARLFARTPELVEQENQIAKTEERWRPVASFVIEFQVREAEDGSRLQRTTAHHVETDTNRIWQGIEQVALGVWMMEEQALTPSDINAPPPSTPQSEQTSMFAGQPLTGLPTRFSEKLQRVLATSRELAKTLSPADPLQLASMMPAPTAAQPQVAPPPATQQSAKPTGYSERLQQVLARSQAISGKTG
jgi:hypothetical protein